MKYEMYRDVVSQVTQEFKADDSMRERELWDVLVALSYAYPDLQEKYAEEVSGE